MTEFNGRQFYGFSMFNDPDLVTSTKNFEFKYARPEILEKVIQKVHYTAEAKCKNKNMNWYNYCRSRIEGAQNESGAAIPEMKRDLDIDTHMSKYIQASYRRVRNLTDIEVDELIDKAKRITQNGESNRNVQSSGSKAYSIYDESAVKITERDTACQTEDYKYHGLETSSSTQVAQSTLSTEEFTENNRTSTNNETNGTTQTSPTTEIGDTQSRTMPIIHEVSNTLEEIDKPQAQLNEVIEPQSKENSTEATQMNRTTKVKEQEQQREQRREEDFATNTPHMPANFDYFSMPMQGYDCTCLPAMLMNEMVLDNVRLAGGQNLNSYMEPTIDTYIVEDSDLEFEIYNRHNYTKYCKPRPKIDELGTESIDENHGPTFIEIETNINDPNMSYIRNASPIQFTEITEDITEGHTEATEFKVDLSRKNIDQVVQLASESKASSPTTTDRTKQEGLNKSATIKRRSRLSGGREVKFLRPPTPISAKTYSNESNVTVETVTSTTMTSPKQPSQTKCKVTKSVELMPQTRKQCENIKVIPKKRPKRLKKNLCVSKSIEDLKTQKTNIFSKMTCTQERIIEVLDKLRLNMLELNVSDDSPYDKLKRQRNAFEFSVRFSRNFLYPLKSMVNDIKYTPNDQFTSLTSNDACARICYIYTLFLQSLQTFQKQLRYFLLDQVPQKLNALIEMLYTTTNLCLEKQIFSPQDIIVDCLQQRVIKFIDFMGDLHEGRLEVARRNHRKLTMRQASSKYDLKMFMNDLNMYEPKLVLKSSEKRAKKTKAKKTASAVQVVQSRESQESVKEKPAEDAIATQMEDLANTRSSVLSLTKASHTTLKPEKSKPDTTGEVEIAYVDGLDQRVLEALQNITKEQVRQILDPIFDSLGVALDGKNNSEMIESLVNAFNNKVFNTLEMEAQKLANKYGECNSNGNSNNNINVNGISQVAVSDNCNDNNNCNNGNDNNNNNNDNSNNNENHHGNSARATEILEQQKSIDCCLTQSNQEKEVAVINADSFHIIKRSNNNNNSTSNNDKNNNNNSTNNNNNNNANQQISNEHEKKYRSENQTEYETDYEPQTENEIKNENIPETIISGVDDDDDDDEIFENILTMAYNKSQMRSDMKKLESSNGNLLLNGVEGDADLNLSSNEESTIASDTYDRRLTSEINKNKMKKFKKKEIQREDRKTVLPRELNNLMRMPGKTRVKPHNTSPYKNNAIKSKSFENIIDDSASCYSAQSTPISSAHQSQDQSKKCVRKKYRIKKKKIYDPPPPTPVVSPVSSSGLLKQDPASTNVPQTEETGNGLKNISHVPQIKLRPTKNDGKNNVKNNVSIVKSPSGMNYVELFRNSVPFYSNNSPYDTSEGSINIDSVSVVAAAGKRQNSHAVTKEQGNRERKIFGKGYNEANEIQEITTTEASVITPTTKKSTNGNAFTSNRNEILKSMEKNKNMKKISASKITAPATSMTKIAANEKAKTKAKVQTKGKAKAHSKDKDKGKAKATLLTDTDVEQMLQQRDEFLRLCSKNRFYSNPNYNEPWKVFSTISEQLVNDILGAVEEDFAKGVSKFVDDFLELETKTTYNY